MYKKTGLSLLLLIFLFSSCQTINKSRAELGIKQYNVFFSFDDGPDMDTTPKLLEVLEKYQIKALFCLLGINAEQYPEIVRQIYDKGHCIINHGYYDEHSIGMKDDEFRNNIILGEEVISLSLGHNNRQKLYRPHGGFYNSRHIKICSDEDYIIVPVTVRVYDAVVTSAKWEKIKDKAIKKIINDNGGVILLHDCRGSYLAKDISLKKNPDSSFNRLWIPQIMEEIIIALTEKGFVFPDPDVYVNLLLNQVTP